VAIPNRKIVSMYIDTLRIPLLSKHLRTPDLIQSPQLECAHYSSLIKCIIINCHNILQWLGRLCSCYDICINHWSVVRLPWLQE